MFLGHSVYASANETLFFLNHGYNAKQPFFLDALVVSLENAETIKEYKKVIYQKECG